MRIRHEWAGVSLTAVGLLLAGSAAANSNAAARKNVSITQDRGSGAIAAAESADPLAPLAHGRLLIWVLQPPSSGTDRNSANAPAVAPPAPRSAPAPTYQEHDAGTFGQSASSYGQDAGSYGVASSSSVISAPPSGTGYKQQTAGSFGQPSGNFGTSSSNYGQSASTYGQTASSFGTSSSSTGQTAGSFGNSLSTIATAGIHPDPPQSLTPEQSNEIQQLRQQVQTAFPDLHVRYVSVSPDDLDAQLEAVQNTDRYPDLLVARSPGDWWHSASRQFALATLRNAVFYADGVTEPAAAPERVAVMAHSAHRATAQALALWMTEIRSGCAGCVRDNLSSSAQAAAAVALNAITRLIRGEALGSLADPSIAAFSPQLGLTMLTDTAGTLPPNAPVRFEVMHASTAGHLAVVALRVMASSSNVFALAHPLLVLRQDSNGHWRVLHVSLNLPPSQQQNQREVLVRSIAAAAERASALRGVTLASPVDGDTRPPRPELSWDNGGGASLQVVEWQARMDGAWSDPHLYLAPDVGSRLRTQVTANFASTAATYRWRVWSVGSHGEMKISSWRTFNVLQ